MSMQDPISDLLTRIRNGLSSGKQEVRMPSSTAKVAIVKVLLDEGYLSGYEVTEEEPKKPTLRVDLKYFDGKPVIELIQRRSRPGLREYVGVDEIPQVKTGLGIAVLSTAKGVVSSLAAKQMNVGGEVLCYVA